MNSSPHSLKARYPRIFPEEVEIRCGAGWSELLDELCGQMQALSDLGAGQPIAIQVKEKLGELRFYFSVTGADTATSPSLRPETDPGSWAVFNALVDAARHRSGQTCELCGRRGEIRGGFGVLATRCKAHSPAAWETMAPEAR